MKRIQGKPGNKAKFHPFARNVVYGSLQMTGIWYIFAGILHVFAAYTPDYFRALLYRDAALEIAPVTLAAGIVAALVCDLALSYTQTQDKGD